jgi:NitT/TauT family transport system ATP-binding protein
MSKESRVPQVELSTVSKTYGSNPPVLQQIDLTIAKGEFVSLIGPSGCGKSTLLKLISGLTSATSGNILVDGMTPLNARETISYIFQDATLLPWRTVTSNVGLGLELEHVARETRKQKVDTLLELVGLTHVARAYPRQLSGGMKMRVSVARALATIVSTKNCCVCEPNKTGPPSSSLILSPRLFFFPPASSCWRPRRAASRKK